MSLYKDASLVMIPSAYKDGKLYSIRPTDGSGDFTFSRGSNLAATRVDVNGLIEKGRENLLLYSNDFSNAAWDKNIISITSGQADKDGGTTASRLTANSGGQFRRLLQATNKNSVVTASIFVKAGTANFVYMVHSSGSYSSGGYQFFDVANGTLGASSFLKIIDSSIEDAGNGWYKCTLVSEPDALGNIYIGISNNDTNTNVNNGLYVDIQDAQLEQGLVATDYIETGTSAAQSGILEDMPRLDYSGSCPSLLLEPQRSNLITQSEYFGDSSWTKLGSGTASVAIVTSNYATSPDGLQNASRLQCDLNGGTSISDQSLIYDTITGSGDTSAFVYVKSNTGSNQTFYLANTLNDRVSVVATTEWQKFELNWNASANGRSLSIGTRGTTGSDDTLDLLIWGAQVEAASYPTSYIPTYGTSQTRSEDEAGTSAISGLVGANGGSLFLEISYPEFNPSSRFSLSDGTNDNLIYSRTQTSGRIQFLGGNLLLQAPSGFASLNTFYKVAIGFEENNAVMYIDGVQIDTDTSFTMPSGLDYFNFGTTNASINPLRANVKQVLVFPTRLTNAELAALTS